MPRPRVIYDAKPGSPLEVDRAFYARPARAERGERDLVDRLWSCLPYLRPMLTITAGSCHDQLGTVSSYRGRHGLAGAEDRGGA